MTRVCIQYSVYLIMLDDDRTAFLELELSDTTTPYVCLRCCPETKLMYLSCDVWLLNWMWTSLVGGWLKIYLLCQARPYLADAVHERHWL